MTAVYLTDDFLHSALYAIGKTLKGKTSFVVLEDKIIIVGDFLPGIGYVYKVSLENPIRVQMVSMLIWRN
mgnify:CR=1 FL=1